MDCVLAMFSIGFAVKITMSAAFSRIDGAQFIFLTLHFAALIVAARKASSGDIPDSASNSSSV